jgi:hypothetical protein
VLLTPPESQPKLGKGLEFGWACYAMHLAPHNIAGIGNLCPGSTAECRKYCLFEQGRGHTPIVRNARVDRTLLYHNDPDAFQEQLFGEIAKAAKRRSIGGAPGMAVRLNATSDVAWERELPSVFEEFPDVQFYDYTKVWSRMDRFLDGKLPSNYHLTWSRRGTPKDDAKCDEVLARGGNVAVVFDELPKRWRGRMVVTGDVHDCTFLAPPGKVLGLTPKGTLGKAESTFKA